MCSWLYTVFHYSLKHFNSWNILKIYYKPTIQQIIIILMPIKAETLQVLLMWMSPAQFLRWRRMDHFSSWSAHHWKNLLRHAGELADATDVWRQWWLRVSTGWLSGSFSEWGMRLSQHKFATTLEGRFEQEDFAVMHWPPSSPDLTLCNFFLWGFVKDTVFCTSSPC